MYHHPSRAAKTGRVVARDGANIGLHYSLQAQATPVVERPSSKQSIDWKHGRDSASPSRPTSATQMNSKYRSKPGSPLSDDKLAPDRAPSVLQYSRSTTDTSMGSRQQNYATPSFHELHKVQKQVLQPSSVYNSDNQPTANQNSREGTDTEDDRAGQQMRPSLSAGSQARPTKNQVFLPGDRVIFAESPSAPGIPIVYRLPEERQANPDRLNLDRRRLTVCPILEGEDNLRLLNFQHNLIRNIQHLANLRRLIFLDIYDNQIEEISGLSSLKSLRVLMLGKNRIRKINNLEALTKLDVLDLHGNRISKIENLSHLTELRVLNLAGNEILKVCNISGMRSLAELNLRRNKICTVEEVDRLSNLQRLFLSFNCISRFEDINCLTRSTSITELSLDGNPFASDVTYKQTVLKSVTCLRQLDMKRITEEERRIAMVMARKEEEKKKEVNKLAVLKSYIFLPHHLTKGEIKEKRRIAINNAQRQWELTQAKTSNRSNGSPLNDAPVSQASSSSGVSSITTDANDNNTSPETSPLSICHLAELDGETLYLYGPGSLDALDRNWGAQAVNSVSVISFKFIEYDAIVPHFHKIGTRFPSLVGLIFTETSINNLQQINALAMLRRLETLVIHTDRNPVTEFTLWRPYVLFRLAHLSLTKINDIEVTAADKVNAEKLFGNLAHLTTSQLPQSRLLTLLGDSKRRGVDDKAKKTEGKHERTSSNESVGRIGLQYWPVGLNQKQAEETESRKTFAENYIKEITQNSILVDRKQKRLDTILPNLFSELIQKAVIDLNDRDKCMERAFDSIRQRK
ncbi:leucine-rich repeat-containing protein 49 isoform X2 [Nematostella vectensis]|uniref:leucine-rich repeat-containing protein 49 isoform X2 n=1 Tax=Nematostella vectensis TaxID=45351 RepID=UPI0020778BBF|nr:leucine-rich repeat-containing protein 49 isoform X2 [Nematostella vectensis]